MGLDNYRHYLHVVVWVLVGTVLSRCRLCVGSYRSIIEIVLNLLYLGYEYAQQDPRNAGIWGAVDLAPRTIGFPTGSPF